MFGETKRTLELGLGIAGAFLSLCAIGLKPLDSVCLSISACNWLSWLLDKLVQLKAREE